MTRGLLIGPDQERLIAGLTARAAAEVVPYEEMKRWAAAAPGVQEELRHLNTAMTIHLPVGFQVTLTHEEHKPGVVCRHLSVSVEAAGKGPHPAAVAMIMQAFGFKNRLGQLPTWTEDCNDGRYAVNVVEPLDGDMRKLVKPS